MYRQLTDEQIGCLYSIDSDYVFTGEKEEFFDTVYFTVNEADTIGVPVSTQMSKQLNFFYTGFYDVYGVSSLDFNNHPFKQGAIEVVGSSGSIVASLGIPQSDYDFNSSLPPSSKSNTIFGFMPTDTARVGNKVFAEVYKFSRQEMNDYHFNFTGFKKVYFAKGFGFILIETPNGTKLEYINN